MVERGDVPRCAKMLPRNVSSSRYDQEVETHRPHADELDGNHRRSARGRVCSLQGTCRAKGSAQLVPHRRQGMGRCWLSGLSRKATHHEWMHSSEPGPSDVKWSGRLPCSRRPRFSVLLPVPVVLLAAGVRAAEEQWGRHKQWKRVHQQNAAELVAEQLVRDLHPWRSSGPDSLSPHGRVPRSPA